ncbi:Peptidyl-prolyl cis-trans isomerase-like 1 [Geodia barretti]|uniref:Peptidyl-prolyl cis-trans isomerase n=1 Tax=Geodia barretti TaxID=519541 RepID=A0AA35RX08_GEOBA|nr:Peptidyl-prolyl cis-trans isomerase-like 1 [Geodia barretti]
MAQPKGVHLETSMGEVAVELYWKHAPKTCRNFAELARSGYYNNCKFHRIIKEFMIQGGDPTGTGRGGSSIYGGQFEDELSEDLKHTGAGIISMANSGPNSNGSKHTIFGRVCAGIAVVKQIGMVETDSADRPVENIVILRAYPVD